MKEGEVRQGEIALGHLVANFETRKLTAGSDWRTDIEPDPALVWAALVEGAPGVIRSGEVSATGCFHVYRSEKKGQITGRDRNPYRVCDCACSLTPEQRAAVEAAKGGKQ